MGFTSQTLPKDRLSKTVKQRVRSDITQSRYSLWMRVQMRGQKVCKMYAVGELSCQWLVERLRHANV